MASWDSMVTSALSGLTGVVKAAVIFFVFANILWPTGMDPLGGIMNLVDTFLNGGVTGLLVLVVFLSWL
ncbi:MAG: hypothetical protein VX852_01215 [Candidatus Neomarinimicrobiota bacterium]|jgi:hypothetical protein|nr:hypothetical protein [Candidatus Neomarinimicrobiota bacterium]|tara:strand:+ start:40 stop:246 length:207 start_codon:yes stop_codon:yes gene_type:complete